MYILIVIVFLSAALYCQRDVFFPSG